MTTAFGDQESPMMTSANNIGEGWHQIIRDLETKLNAIDPDFELQQVKEKFGGLRYYAQTKVTGDRWHDFHRAVADAEEESDHTCEQCGKPGENHSISGWLKTLCPEHEAELRARREQERKRLS